MRTHAVFRAVGKRERKKSSAAVVWTGGFSLPSFHYNDSDLTISLLQNTLSTPPGPKEGAPIDTVEKLHAGLLLLSDGSEIGSNVRQH